MGHRRGGMLISSGLGWVSSRVSTNEGIWGGPKTAAAGLWLEGIQLRPEMNNEINFLPISLCFINVYTYPNPKPTPYNNDKNCAVFDVRMPSSAICILSSLNSEIGSFW